MKEPKQMELFSAPTETGNIERRSFNTIFKRAESGRTVEGYAAVFNSETDLGWFSEVIEPGAFDNAIMTSDCRALFNHDSNALLARQSSGTLMLSVDGKGLKYEFESPSTTVGNDILVMMERGDLKESSFAFTVKKEAWEYEEDETGKGERSKRIIMEVEELYDVSPVTYPAYQDTTVAKRSRENWARDHQQIEQTPEEADLDDLNKFIKSEEKKRGLPVELVRAIFG